MSSSPNEMTTFDVSAYPQLPRGRGLFVTGTDTDIGKTVVAGGIARALRQGGEGVEVYKPVASGCRLNPRGGLISSDAEFLAACGDSTRPLSDITPVRFREALAPNVAAARADKTVDLQAIFDGWSRLTESGLPIIVEGVGGLLCPLSDDFWVIHLAKMLQLPLVVVVRPDLGTINHTLLTLHAARSAGLTVAGVVINRWPADPDPIDTAIKTNPQQLADRGDVPILARVPNDADTDVDKATLGPETQLSLKQVNWLELM